MKETIEKLAILMHDAWRKKKIKEEHWHIPENCPHADPYDCHKCAHWFTDPQYSDGCVIDKKGYTDPPTGCKEYTTKPCEDCRSEVNTWNNLTKKEKTIPLMNAKIAYNFFNSTK